MASPADSGMARMIPIDFVHAAAETSRPGADEQAYARFRKAKRETALPKVGARRLRALRSAMDKDGQQNRPLWSVTDVGGLANRTFLKDLPPRTVATGRIRASAKLYHLPEPTEGKPGRNRVYGKRATTPEELRLDASIPWQKMKSLLREDASIEKIKTLAPLRWRPAGKEYDLRLIVIAPLGLQTHEALPAVYGKAASIAPIRMRPFQRCSGSVWRWDIESEFPRRSAARCGTGSGAS